MFNVCFRKAHASGTRQLPQYLDPFEINDNGFPVNRNVTIALCAFLAMVALWLLRHRDHWSLDELLTANNRQS